MHRCHRTDPPCAPVVWLAAMLSLVAGTSGRAPAAAGVEEKPRLVLVITLDQFRADYLTRFRDLYLPPRAGGAVGGFRFLMEEGAWLVDARHDHFPLFTGPGNAVALTGAPPGVNGIVANDWYDRSWRRLRNCVEDPNSPIIGRQAGAAGENKGVSPASLLASTVGDELEIATGGRAKVWGIAIKDRTAVLLPGHLGDGAVWYDDTTGAWLTSRHFARTGRLPGWLEARNARKRADDWFGTLWMPSVPAGALSRLWTPDNQHAGIAYGMGSTFPHRIDGGLKAPGREYYRALRATPFSNVHVLETAREIVKQEGLGRDEVPDILAVGLSSLDYAGHMFGPDSAEVLEAAVQTDRQLAGFFAFLGSSVQGGLASVTIVLSADHGVAPAVRAARAGGLPGGVFDEGALREAAERALDAAFGHSDWTATIEVPNLYLNWEAIDARGISREAAEEVAAAALAGVRGIHAAWTRTRILSGRLPRTGIADRVARSYHPKVSGDVVFVPEAFWVPSDSARGATHGAPWTYDASVPLLFAGRGISAGRRLERVSTLDVAPTLAVLLGILPPSGSEGRILSQALAER